MKQFITLLIFSFCITSSVIGQADAKKILDGVGAKVKSFKAISGGFSIKSITNKGQANGTKTGSISMKGNKYLIKQGKTEILCDGSKTYSFDGSKTITVSPAEDASKSLTPQKILSGNYDKDFTYKLISSVGTTHEIELLPIDSRKNFKKVTVYIDKVKNLITKAKVLDKSNNILEFNFTNINTSTIIADATFVFNKTKYPKDVEILD